ncbi:alpha/beta fold hydrolase [Runella salmonicolor]|uniref:Alpha/beta hydrolase n=1 Tax=Runella salmonicolor TaxID=2950278 RepID=A0ABT1FQ39_9BACT|nr:alpha/beta hydrolase [Runella salmonicolor]MCP1382622.1 alpha/beta hydrolase [Runella salmonicolor]
MRKKLLFVSLFLLVSLITKAQTEGWAICNSGANLYFKIVGSGSHVLVVGDVGNSSAYLKDLIKKLSETNRVVYYDPRATGKSRFPVINDSTINFTKAVADIEALRMVLRIPKWSVIAHGFGAKIACAYASQAGNHLAQLVLINPTAMTESKPIIANSYFDNYEEYGFSRMLSQEVINRRFEGLQHQLQTQIMPTDSLARARAIMAFQAATYVHDTLHEPIAADFLYEKVRNVGIKSRVSTKFVPNPLDCITALRQRNVPVLVVVSRQRYDLNRLVNFWKKSVPNVTISLIDRAHHFPWLDNPAAFYAQVTPFLQRFVEETYAEQKKASRPVGRGNQRGKRY